MADKKISELPLLNSVSGSSMIIPVVHDGTTTKVNLSQIGHYASQWSAKTGSANTFTGTQTINGNVNISGRLTVHEIVANYETSSILFSTGSTKLGDQLTDIHEFTGSTNITGSFYYNNVLVTNIDANTVFKLQQATASIQSATSSLNQATSSLNFASGALEIASGSYNRFYQATQSLHLASASLNYFYQATASVHSTTASLNQATSSLNFASGALEIASGSYNRFYQATQSLHLATQSLNYFYQATASVHSTTASLNQATSSLNFATGALQIASESYNRFYQATQSLHLATQSLNYFYQQTSSQDLVNRQISLVTESIHFVTGAFNSFTGSVIGQVGNIATFSGSVNFATQSLNTQTGSQDLVNRGISSVTGSINTTTSSFDLVFRGISSVTGAINLTTSSLIGITNGLMAFTAALDNTYATDAQLYQLYQATASIHSATASLNTQTGSQANLNAQIGIATASLNTQTGSQANLNAQIGIATSSLNTFSGSIRGEISGLEAYTASLKAAAIVSSSTQITNYYKFAETASANTFYGNQTFNNNVTANKFVFTDGVINTNVGGQYIIATSGNVTYLYTGTSGLNINDATNGNINVSISNVGAVQTRGKLTVGAPGNDQDIAFGGSNAKLDWAGTGAQIFYSVGALQFSSVGTTNNMILQQQAGALFNAGITGSLMATNGVVSSSAQLPQIAGLQAYTASLKGAIEVSGQNVNVLGMITAQQFNVTYVSSSVMYQSGSTKVGNTFDDRHEVTGSLSVSGSMDISGSIQTFSETGIALESTTGVNKITGRRSNSLADNGTLDTGVNQSGLLIVNTNNDRCGLFLINAIGGGSSTVTEISDPASYFSVASGTASSFNVYFVAGSGNVIVENKTGAARGFSLTILGGS